MIGHSVLHFLEIIASKGLLTLDTTVFKTGMFDLACMLFFINIAAEKYLMV